MSEERLLWQGRPSFWNYWSELMVADLLILLAAALWWTDRLQWAPWPLAGAVPLYLAVFARRACVLYSVTDQRVSARVGLFSRRVAEVELRDIRNIVLEQGFLQRLIGLGTVGVSTSAGDGVEVTLTGIPGADSVKETIRSARLAAGGKPEPPAPPAGGPDA